MASPVFFLFSNANWLAAASIWRRLLIQAFACEVARALTKFGIAIAAKRPMMATTIMISTSVKPALRVFLICFICTFWSTRRGRRDRRVLYDDIFAHIYCLSLPHGPKS